VTTEPIALQRMRRDLAGELPAPSWPQGYEPRAFREADAPEVHRLMQLAYAGGLGGEVAPFDAWWPALRDDAEYAPDLVFLAALEGQLVAVAQCWTSAFVKDLVVHPDHRRRGLGEALMTTAFAAFRTRGAPHVDLKVRIGNTPAERLYRRLGMIPIPIEG
jgi:ribosomal protein S18 acetylase RimI-like enzyme